MRKFLVNVKEEREDVKVNNSDVTRSKEYEKWDRCGCGCLLLHCTISGNRYRFQHLRTATIVR